MRFEISNFKFQIQIFSFQIVLPALTKTLVICLAFVSLAGLSCRSVAVPRVETPTRDVRDDLGKTVRVPEKIERAISLAPSLTEMIFAIGAGDRLVGVTTYCNFPAGTANIEKVGDTQSPNIEKIIALKPQIVFISTASQLEAFQKTLDEQGIAVYVTNPTRLTEVFANLRQLGDLFGKPEAAESLLETLSARVAEVSKEGNIQGGHRVFIQISNEPLFTIGEDSFLTELVDLAGGVSVTKEVATAYPKLSKETAAALDPDVIFLSDSDDNREPNPALKNSNAVKNERVYRINADIISRPGPRLVDALEEISSKLDSRRTSASPGNSDVDR